MPRVTRAIKPVCEGMVQDENGQQVPVDRFAGAAIRRTKKTNNAVCVTLDQPRRKITFASVADYEASRVKTLVD